MGIGATAARHALDVEIGVRIPDPQLEEDPPFWRIFLFNFQSISQSKTCDEFQVDLVLRCHRKLPDNLDLTAIGIEMILHIMKDIFNRDGS